MTTLSADRNTPRRDGDVLTGLVAASTLVYAGSLVMRNAAGYLVKGQTATGLVGVGRAEERVDNASGSAGDLSASYRPGVYRFANSTSTDEITIAEIGDTCFAVDDQTVAKTDGTGTRSPAGIIEDVDTLGVWVRVDEAVTQARAVADAAFVLASA
ncbi:hypothetical protein [Antarcticimicrobium sediminis]|uniref:Bacteriophage lambda head decoration protein D n=1 Tax=Antarcticimicrobium sediminis TaxID=2546227 RepID=A0A4R5F0L5_9RHOB|nr:hypothetical protein [Antarcticimicrobium sediminis]TDE40931.1 hypothetical protein E1B25_01585 [Antarcticimicrobium sediminis]